MNWGAVIFSNKQGHGYIYPDCYKINEGLREVESVVLGTTIHPGQYTDLSGFFSRTCQYLGLFGKNEMIFYLGNDFNQFFERWYYQSVYLISETRLFEILNHKGGRDFNYINGVWK